MSQETCWKYCFSLKFKVWSRERQNENESIFKIRNAAFKSRQVVNFKRNFWWTQLTDDKMWYENKSEWEQNKTLNLTFRNGKIKINKKIRLSVYKDIKKKAKIMHQKWFGKKLKCQITLNILSRLQLLDLKCNKLLLKFLEGSLNFF